jgi:hypothetical protein
MVFPNASETTLCDGAAGSSALKELAVPITPRATARAVDVE